MFCEQAIFTSLKTRRQEGYQLASTSPGLTSELAKELAQWGPAHDSLLHNEVGATSTNFHRLDSGDYCVSRTTAAGEEYSGRGGPRVYTQMLVVPAVLLARFANNPFSILEAVAASGHLTVYDQPAAELPTIRLLGRASLVNQLRLAELAAQPGVEALVRLLHLLLCSTHLAVRSQIPLDRLLSGLFNLLPLRFRPQFSFSTGLRYSARRPVRCVALPADAAEQRSLQRANGAALLDLTQAEQPKLKTPEGRWAQLIRDALQPGHLGILPELLQRADCYDPTEASLDEVALRVEEEVRAEAG